MAQASFVRLPVVGTPHSGEGIGKVGRARRLHLIQDRACDADAKFGEHGRRGVIGHVCDLLRCCFGIHAGVDLDDVFFRLLQEIFAQLQPFFVFGPLRLEFIDALPEFFFGCLEPLLLPRDAGIERRVGNVAAELRDVGFPLSSL